MQLRLADYVAEFLIEKGVTDIFSVVGGGAMHLNDAFGHNPKLTVTYNHHEQASAMAAEAYARLENKIAAVCVTTGPGGTNALTGVVGGYLDSIPMFIVSGQVRYDTTARFAAKSTGEVVPRAVGDQEYDIVKSVGNMTKYAAMIEDPLTIRYHLEKAWSLATTGRPGPVWIDIPVNYQGMMIDTDLLEGYDSSADEGEIDINNELPPGISDEMVDSVIEAVKVAKRPVIIAGYGIRLSGGYEAFRSVIEKLNVPVVTYWNAIDLIESDHPLYVGRSGNMGDRPGNWAVQLSDLVIAIGSRISIRQTGYEYKDWAPNAKVIMIDIDRGELKKPTLHVDVPIWADAKDFLLKLDLRLSETIKPNQLWNDKCLWWRENYPVASEAEYVGFDGKANVYAFIDYLSRQLPEGSVTAVSNGACCVVGSQTFYIKKGSRFHNNSAIASMGYGLPAAIGSCISAGRRDTVCLEGDGSIMMNLSELMTVITNRLPIKLFLINNNGYHSIRITQSNLFSEHCKVGIGPESKDVDFPEFSQIAKAFGWKYLKATDNEEMKTAVKEALAIEGPVFTEIFTDTTQVWAPKSQAKRLSDGTMVSAPLTELAPFLPQDELKKILTIE